MTAFNRRDSIKSLAAIAATGTFAGWSSLASAQKPMTVGVIYVGPREDYGYNQAHAQAAAEIKKMPGIKVVEEENVPETAAVQKTMTGMIEQDGAKLLFPTSFGYFDPHILAVAPKNPDVRFSHCGGLWSADKHPKNVGSFFGYIDECQYLNGVVAGAHDQEQQDRFRRRQTDSRRCCATSTPSRWARARSSPTITCNVIFTGDWSMAVKEAESHQQPGRPGLRRLHHARRRPQGGRRDGGQARQDGMRLPRQPGQAGTRGLPDRRRMELAHRLQDDHRSRANRQAASQLLARRPQGRLREDLAPTDRR